MTLRKTIIFIDGSNWYHNSKKILKNHKDIDLELLSNLICKKFNFELIEIRYYNSIPDIQDNEKTYHKHLEFLDKLSKKNIIVKTRKLKRNKKSNARLEKGIDVMLATDMIRKTLLENKCDVCILLSGDADFIPAMETIKNSKKEAISTCTYKGYSRELRNGNFRYLILKMEDVLTCIPCKNQT